MSVVGAHGMLWAAGQRWDERLCRWVARLPGVSFPCVDEVEHEWAALVARDLLAEKGAA